MKRLLNILLASFVMALLFSQAAIAQDVSAQNNRKARLEKEIQVLDSQLKANAKKSASALTSLTLTQKKIENRKALIRESDQEIAGMDRSIKSIQHRVDSLSSRLDTEGQNHHICLLASFFSSLQPTLQHSSSPHKLRSRGVFRYSERFTYLLVGIAFHNVHIEDRPEPRREFGDKFQQLLVRNILDRGSVRRAQSPGHFNVFALLQNIVLPQAHKRSIDKDLASPTLE